MKEYRNICFCLSILFLPSILSAQNSKYKNIVLQDELKRVIANSITIPNHNGDTVIYYTPERSGPFCGNANRKSHRRFYQPHLSNIPYQEILINNYSGTMLFINKKDPGYDPYFLEKNPSYSANKIFMEITGYRYNNKKIEITEAYWMGKNGSSMIIKLFTYKNNQWTFVITAQQAWQ